MILRTCIAGVLLGLPLQGQKALEHVAGYAAKVTASAIFVGGRDLGSVLRSELLAVNPVERGALGMVLLHVDRERGEVQARIPFLASATAVYREGLGCALLAGEEGGAEAVADRVRGQALEPAAPVAGSGAGPVAPPTPAALVSATDTAPKALIQWLEEAVVDREDERPQRTRAVLVLHQGRLLAESYAAGFGADSLHAGWSMAKTVTGILLQLRAQSGHLDLDAGAPVAAWQGKDDPRRAITPRHLLRMSSGLRFGENYLNLTSDAMRMLFGSSDAAAVGIAAKLAHAPGSRWAYSSGTSNVLQAVLRSTFPSAEDYQRWPREALFVPAGLPSALLEADASGTFVGSSFCWMTARDWARLGQLLLDDGVVYLDAERRRPRRILSAESVRWMRRPAPAAKRGHYGGHLWLNRGPAGKPESRPFPRLPEDLFYASGYEGQLVLALPSLQTVIVRLGVSKLDAPFDLEAFVLGILTRMDSE